MLIHIILIFAMNNITTALEFMADEEIRLLPKLLFLMGSLLLFLPFSLPPAGMPELAAGTGDACMERWG